jgi:hypothetical protein
MNVRRACKSWLLAHPPPGVESASAWRDKIMPFGYGNDIRKQGNDHSLRGLAGAFKTRINVIVVTTRDITFNNSTHQKTYSTFTKCG